VSNAPTQAVIERCIRAAQRAGLPVSGYELRPDGSIRILTSSADASAANDTDDWFEQDAQRTN
jgi:hypothetical protein